MNKQGILYVCATPIGNLNDITLRVLETLKSVDVIAAEDTRRSIKLLNHFEISKKLMSYHEHNKAKKGQEIVEMLLAGKNIALVSDAGMPGISDPGEDIIKLCIENGIEFYVLPGASAAITALVGSGMGTERFIFDGFLDRKKKSRADQLAAYRQEERTIILYEAPHRLKETLKDIEKVLGNIKITVARELTKRYEEKVRGTVAEVLMHFEAMPPKGEFVIIFEGLGEDKAAEAWEALTIEEHLTQRITEGLSKKEAVRIVAKERQLPKKDVYKVSIDL